MGLLRKGDNTVRAKWVHVVPSFPSLFPFVSVSIPPPLSPFLLPSIFHSLPSSIPPFLSSFYQPAILSTSCQVQPTSLASILCSSGQMLLHMGNSKVIHKLKNGVGFSDFAKSFSASQIISAIYIHSNLITFHCFIIIYFFPMNYPGAWQLRKDLKRPIRDPGIQVQFSWVLCFRTSHDLPLTLLAWAMVLSRLCWGRICFWVQSCGSLPDSVPHRLFLAIWSFP